jgi:endonuclease YncB( thermonuclease family)
MAARQRERILTEFKWRRSDAREDRMRLVALVLCVALPFTVFVSVSARDDKKPKPVAEKPKVLKDRVKGSVHHGKGKKEWERITGRVEVIDAHTLQMEDGTRLALAVVAPELQQKGMIAGSLYPCGKEAAEFLRKLIGDRPVTCFLVAEAERWIGYVGDTNITHAMVLNGWALADHSSLHAAEIIARENERGLWRGQFLDPDDWLAGKRLAGEE